MRAPPTPRRPAATAAWWRQERSWRLVDAIRGCVAARHRNDGRYCDGKAGRRSAHKERATSAATYRTTELLTRVRQPARAILARSRPAFRSRTDGAILD